MNLFELSGNYPVLVTFNTALQAAVWGCEGIQEEVVQLLLEANADPDDSGVSGGTGLQEAAFWGDEPMVKHLLEANADVNLHCEGEIEGVRYPWQ